MTRFRRILFLNLALLLVSSMAWADREAQFRSRVQSFRQLPVTDHARHGQRAFKVAKAFCKKNNIPHFETTMANGQKRLVMNVQNKDMAKYKKVFSKQFMENFFSASGRSKPGWSYLRVGDKIFKQFGSGERYRKPGYGTRVAFPYSVSKDEMSTRMDAIQNTPNPPFDSGRGNIGGVLSGKFLRNCTDWLTSAVGSLTGKTTNSVVAHAGALWDGRTSERMTVQVFITDKKMPNFGPEVLTRSW